MKQKHAVIAYGRMNPGPTIGHERVINMVKNLADIGNAHHEVILSRTQDRKKNPLSPEQKLKYCRIMFPDVNFRMSSDVNPTLLHHLSRLHGEGIRNLTLVAGPERIPEFSRFVVGSNGKKGNYGFYEFPHIHLVTSGIRNEHDASVVGASSTKMRDHARNNDFHSFRKMLPSNCPPSDALNMFLDTRKGMEIKDTLKDLEL